MRLISYCVIAFSMALAGCNTSFPSFSKGDVLAKDINGENIPVPDVVNALKCELDEFFGKQDSSWEFRLDDAKAASVKLSLKTTTNGSIGWSKIDIGSTLESVLVVGDTKTASPYPNLSAGTKAEVGADIGFKILQKKGDTSPLSKNCGPGIEYKINPFNIASPGKFGIGEWLFDFFENTNKHKMKGGPEVRLNTIKLTTQFTVSVGGDAGVFPTIKLIPLNGGFPVGKLGADHVHSLTITFAMHCDKKKADPKNELCTADKGDSK